MKVFSRFSKIPGYRNPVVALGVFDGVHRGHRHILQAMVSWARRIKGTSIVITFYPHPQGEESIYSLPHRIRLFGELGIAVCIVVPFDKRFARIEASDFIERILVKKIKAKYIFIGKNFRFGQKARGDVSLLQELSLKYHFKVKAFSVVKFGTRAISSTLIRKLILLGRLRQAQRLLLRPVSVLGKVVRGTGLATRLGFPTANIRPEHEIVPPPGIYCVWALLAHKRLGGICYIGSSPTFQGSSALRLPVRQAGTTDFGNSIEVYIFDFHKNIYGQVIEIQFLSKIRQERAFSSPQALIAQIEKDILRAKKFFSPH